MPIYKVVTGKILKDIEHNIQMRDKLEEVPYTNILMHAIEQKLGLNITSEEREQNQIALYKKMTDYGMLDHNKFNTIVITFNSANRVFYTTAVVRETFVVTYDFCKNICEKHMSDMGCDSFRFGRFIYGIQDTDIIDQIGSGLSMCTWAPTDPISNYSNIKKDRCPMVKRWYGDRFYEFIEL